MPAPQGFEAIENYGAGAYPQQRSIPAQPSGLRAMPQPQQMSRIQRLMMLLRGQRPGMQEHQGRLGSY